MYQGQTVAHLFTAVGSQCITELEQMPNTYVNLLCVYGSVFT